MFLPRPAWFCLSLFALMSGALAAPAPLETSALHQLAARNLALPAAPHLEEADLSRRSRLREVTLSPDGAWVAYLEAGDTSASLQLLNLATQQSKPLLAGLGRARLHWSRDSLALFVDSGDALSLVRIGDGASTRLAAFDRAQEQRFVRVDPSRPQSALVDEFDAAAQRYRLARIGADGVREVLYEGAHKLLDFLQDSQGQPSFIRTLDERYRQQVVRRQDGKWSAVTLCPPQRACELVAASADGRRLTMLQPAAGDLTALVQLDLAGNSRRVLHSDPAALADLERVTVSVRTGEPLFAVYDAPHRRNLGLTAPARQGAADIARRFPDAAISIDAGAARWLLTERGARLSQERYWLYDPQRRSVAPILQRARALGQPLPEAQLADKIALHYRASDGALVHGYLSLPPGKDASRLPLLTMVHGGPWGAFDGGYTTLVQLLVNRGVAVFQPNFRASTGYGGQYLRAPKGDFGNGRVQADIIDGVHWLVANGIGDPRRLAIMGDSFGGYATLLALTHTPELFQFGMAMVPPTDFARTMRAAAAGPAAPGEMPFALKLADYGVDVGDAAAMARIASESPAANTAKVSKPLLVIAGGKDKMVDIAGVTDYVARLQGSARPVSLLVDPDEGHNPRKPILRQAYVYLLLRMLHQHLGGPPVPAPSVELAAYLAQTMKANGSLAP
ncbi:MAG: prolyl oligopeptidase family serine peptidase [Pseudomonadota bacterium]|nr:prolyl oligopeptidase family serine peptidase [Pseudomonadota bacterium]